MTSSPANTHQKALMLNLDDRIYGTIAEIGAAQEVARWFFRVGAAAGSIAKTMSAYDKQISDDIYGEAGRYVSRQRVEAMLEKEYALLLERLTPERGGDTRFFAFCNTVSARNFAGSNECHGWVGLRFQATLGGEPNTLILHINMIDDTAVAQQEAVGILGVNLIHAAFFELGTSSRGLASLADNIGSDRLEADLVDASGPAFDGFDAIAASMEIVKSGLAKAVLLDGNGRQQPPTEVFHKRPAIIERTSLRDPAPPSITSLEPAAHALLSESPSPDREPLKVSEVSLEDIHSESSTDTDQLAALVHQLVDGNDWVMLSGLDQSYKLNSYFRRYSQQPVRYVLGVSSLAMLFLDKFYEDSQTSLLEATGKLYQDDARIYVRSMPYRDFRAHLDSVITEPDWFDLRPGDSTVSLESLRLRGPVQRLFEYLLESDRIIALSTSNDTTQ